MRRADWISLVPAASEVSRFNTWFDEKSAASGISEPLASDLKLCVDEVLANSISYGFRGVAKPWIMVRIRLKRGRASATIVDNGAYFDLRDWQVPKERDLATAEVGGFGIALIKERASEIRYWRFCGRNHLKVICDGRDP